PDRDRSVHDGDRHQAGGRPGARHGHGLDPDHGGPGGPAARLPAPRPRRRRAPGHPAAVGGHAAAAARRGRGDHGGLDRRGVPAAGHALHPDRRPPRGAPPGGLSGHASATGLPTTRSSRTEAGTARPSAASGWRPSASRTVLKKHRAAAASTTSTISPSSRPADRSAATRPPVPTSPPRPTSSAKETTARSVASTPSPSSPSRSRRSPASPTTRSARTLPCASEQ